MNFLSVEENLRQSFRVLAVDRPGADVIDLPGLSIASLGAKFQMFNAAFLNSAADQSDFERRLDTARDHFRWRALPWALWICEDWLDGPLRRRLSQICQKHGLRLSSEMPGMVATEMDKPKRALPSLDIRPVDSARVLADFRGIGSVCFHVPIEWFSEVFDESVPASRPGFRCWVGYLDGMPIATAASVPSRGVTGLYNIATAPGHRGRGFAEAITRHAVAAAGDGPLVLQSTAHGLRLYERLGFRAVTRILVYNSAR
jgi:ribosomal protein S18 acetylase RimI-like enzyme